MMNRQIRVKKFIGTVLVLVMQSKFKPWKLYFPFPPALIKYKEPARLNYLASTLILIFLGTLMSRPLYKRQLSDCRLFSETA